jgi:hypothetical protein
VINGGSLGEGTILGGAFVLHGMNVGVAVVGNTGTVHIGKTEIGTAMVGERRGGKAGSPMGRNTVGGEGTNETEVVAELGGTGPVAEANLNGTIAGTRTALIAKTTRKTTKARPGKDQVTNKRSVSTKCRFNDEVDHGMVSSYREEVNPGYCDVGYYLEGSECVTCGTHFVNKQGIHRGEGEWTPGTGARSVYCCQARCKEQGDKYNTQCQHAYCNKCWVLFRSEERHNVRSVRKRVTK